MLKVVTVRVVIVGWWVGLGGEGVDSEDDVTWKVDGV